MEVEEFLLVAVLELFLLQFIGLLFPLQSIVDLVEPNFGDVALVGFLQSFQCRGVACVPLFLQFVVGVLPLDPIGFRLLEKFVYLLFFGCGRLLLLKSFVGELVLDFEPRSPFIDIFRKAFFQCRNFQFQQLFVKLGRGYDFSVLVFLLEFQFRGQELFVFFERPFACIVRVGGRCICGRGGVQIERCFDLAVNGVQHRESLLAFVHSVA